MCRELEALRQSILCYAKAFDARSLIPSQAAEVVQVCSQMVATLDTMKSLAAAVAAEGNSWKEDGYRSPAEQLAAQTGMSTGRAKQVLDTGRRLADRPAVAQSALEGELSPEQAAIVADAAEANPDKTDELIEKARTASVTELRDEAARVKADASDADERRKRIQAARRLRLFKDLEGAFQAHVVGHPEDGANLHRLIVTIRRRLNMLSREEGRFETLEALDYDALMTLTRVALGQESTLDLGDLVELGLFPQLKDGALDFSGAAASPPSPSPSPAPPAPSPAPPAPSPALDDPPAGTDSAPSASPAPPPKRKKLAGSPAKIIVRVDLCTLLRGVALEGEMCEIDGYGPIPVSVVEDLVAQGGIVAALLTKGKQVLSVYHHRRRPNAQQKTALEFIYPTCAVAGCNARSGLQSDHREDWHRTYFTVLDLLDHLCPHHHKLKTEKHWMLVDGHGKRPFVPPNDPRHPKRRC